MWKAMFHRVLKCTAHAQSLFLTDINITMRFTRLALFLSCFLSLTTLFAQQGEVTTYSTIDALLAGTYDGTFTVGELKRRGNFGIGTFHALDGEMLMLDGKVYQVKADGRSRPVKDTTRIPWATVSFFEGGHAHALPASLTYGAFPGAVDRLLPSPNLFYAIRAEGTFAMIKVRSVPAQTKPYPAMARVVDAQSVFTYQQVKGTVIGYRCPAYVKGVNVPGYHLHFLSADRKRGGHVLDFTLEKGVVKTKQYGAFALQLPTSGDFLEVDLTTDKAEDLQKVEK
jgi:acetolactate decarboxylase